MSTKAMVVIEKQPRKFNAIQFNKEGDVPGVKRGYEQTKGNHSALLISDAMPRSMECKFCYVLENGNDRYRINAGDWVLLNQKSGAAKVVSDKKFKEKYVQAPNSNSILRAAIADEYGDLGTDSEARK
jgi:hypothetical protein